MLLAPPISWLLRLYTLSRPDNASYQNYVKHHGDYVQRQDKCRSDFPFCTSFPVLEIAFSLLLSHLRDLESLALLA